MKNLLLAAFTILLAVTTISSCKKNDKNENKTVSLKVSLGSPANGSTISNSEPAEFSWEASSSNTTVPLSYKIIIVEVTGDQTLENALHNKPFFEKDTFVSKFIQYPVDAKSPRFVAGSKYAWQVTATQEGLVTQGGASAISVFTIKKDDNATLTVTLGSPADGGSVSGLQQTQFSWTGSSSNTTVPLSYHIKIVEVTDGQTPEIALHNKPFFEKDTFKSVIQFPPDPRSPGFAAGHKYAWQVSAKQDGLVTTGGESDIRVFTIPDRLTVTLGSPADGDMVSNSVASNFSWTGSSSNSTVPITYKISIVEITGDQTPENALHTNKPFFEKDTIKSLNIQYPVSAGSPGFVVKGKYAWQVTAKQDGLATEGGESAISVFTVKE